VSQTPPVLSLFLLSYDNSDGEPDTIVVCAETAEQAVNLAEDFFGIETDRPAEPSDASEDVLTVFLIKATGQSGILGWNELAEGGSLQAVAKFHLNN
jgi:hypothetical protein